MSLSRKNLVSSVALIVGCGWCNAAFGQAADAAPQDSVSYNEIVVTAQKREERLSDVPMVVSAFSGSQLKNLGVENVGDLVKVTPGLTVSTTYSDTPVYTIRGVGFYENSLAVTPAVSVYLDQVPLPYSVMTEGAAFDVQRVEVLKGPQGSLFGQNATGGAINYVPNGPTDHFTAGGRVGYGNFDAVHADGYVSGPLADGVKARLSGTFDNRDAWQTSQSRPDDKNGKLRFGAGRFLLDVEPTDTLKLQFNANGWINKSDSPAWQFQGIRPSNPNGYQVALDSLAAYQAQFGTAPRDAKAADWDEGIDLSRDDSFYQFSLRASLDAGPVQVTSISSYSKYKRDALSDGDGTNYTDLLTNQKGNIESFFQELRFNGDLVPDRARWMLGLNYSRDITEETQLAGNRGTNNLTPFGLFYGLGQENNQKINAMGVFGSLDVDLTSTLKLQGSARYTVSDNHFSGCVRDVNGTVAAVFSRISSAVTGSPVTIAQGQCVTLLENGLPSITPVKRTLSEDNISWRTSLSWKPTRDTLVFASAARGYKAGSFAALPAASVTQLTPVPQESVLAFEAGVKQRLFNSLDIEVAGFHYDYTNKQLRGNVDVPPLFLAIPALVSVPKSKVNGVEGSINWRPVRGLWFNVGAIYVDTKVSSSFISKDPEGATVDIKGDVFPYTPKWQWNANARYEFQLTEGLSAFVGASARHQNVSRSGFGDNPSYNIPGYTLLDLSAGLAGKNDSWRLEIWGRNVTDKYYVNNITRPLDTIASLAGMPATYGVTLGFSL